MNSLSINEGIGVLNYYLKPLVFCQNQPLSETGMHEREVEGKKGRGSEPKGQHCKSAVNKECKLYSA